MDQRTDKDAGDGIGQAESGPRQQPVVAAHLGEEVVDFKIRITRLEALAFEPIHVPKALLLILVTNTHENNQHKHEPRISDSLTIFRCVSQCLVKFGVFASFLLKGRVFQLRVL